MKILHLLPGESSGDTAEIVLTTKALDALVNALQTAKVRGYAHAQFIQRDLAPFTLSVEVNNARPTSHAWRAYRLSYMLGRRRHEGSSLTGAIDLELLATQLFTARRVNRHNQRQAAKAMRVSLGFVSNIENTVHTPKPENFLRLCQYIGKPPEAFIIPEESLE